MDEFLAFLAIGLVLLAIFIAFFSYPFGSPYYYEFETIKDLENTTFVGMDEKITSRNDQILVGISRLSGYDSAVEDEVELINGLFFGKNEVVKHLSVRDIQRLVIKFDVEETNAYGNLIIKVNGDVIRNEVFNEGNYEFYVDDYIYDEMNIEIFCTSSEWRLWAPTLYRLKNLELRAEGYIDNEKVYSFSLEDEFMNFVEGRINLVLDENIGSMTIELNGQELHSGPVSSLQAIQVRRRNLALGDNYLVFRAEDDSKFDGKATLSIMYRKPDYHIFEEKFNITNTNTMKRGIISFDIVSVTRDGALTIEIRNYQGTMFKDFDKVEERAYKFYFYPENVVNGTNLVLIDALEDAGFHIKDLKIKIER